jgi:hypothetical integral membrane protein (TIGR02206 family)
MDRAVATVAILLCAFTQVGPLLPSVYDIHSSLPLAVCDFAAFAAAVALATAWRPARALAYLWGVGLSTQGMFTPDLAFGPATLRFWLFWALHYLVIGGPIYDALGRGFRPQWKDWAIGAAGTVVYTAVILPLDLWLGLNYGYIGRSLPGQPSLEDYLGPWPRRGVEMWLLALLVRYALVLPWEMTRWLLARQAVLKRTDAA